jgi:hypothetical protein
MMDAIIKVVTEEVNYLAVLIAALANFAIGAVWYSFLFGKKWASIVYPGMDTKNPSFQQGMGMIFGLSFVMGFIQAFGLACLLWMPGVSAKHGMLLGAGIALTMVFTNTWKNSLYERRPFGYVMINGTHDFLCFITMGAIVAWWQ